MRKRERQRNITENKGLTDRAIYRILDIFRERRNEGEGYTQGK